MTTIFIILTCVLGYGCYTLSKKLTVKDNEIEVLTFKIMDLEHSIKLLKDNLKDSEFKRDIELQAYATTVDNLRNGYDSEKFESEVTEVVSKPKRKRLTVR
jgi:ribosomal protein L4